MILHIKGYDLNSDENPNISFEAESGTLDLALIMKKVNADNAENLTAFGETEADVDAVKFLRCLMADETVVDYKQELETNERFYVEDNFYIFGVGTSEENAELALNDGMAQYP